MKIKHFVADNLQWILAVCLVAGAINWLVMEFIVKTPSVRDSESRADYSRRLACESAANTKDDALKCWR